MSTKSVKAPKAMTLNEALRVLMQAASNDARGSGMGFRSTNDEWRDQLALAWAVAHRRVYGWEPTQSDYSNSGLRMPEVTRAAGN